METCGRIIRESVHDRRQMQELAQKLAQARALSLIEDRHQEVGLLTPPDEARSSREEFAEKVARNKRLILRTIGKCDPALVERIQGERFPDQITDLPPAIPLEIEPINRARSFLAKTCYAVTLFVALLLVYFILFAE